MPSPFDQALPARLDAYFSAPRSPTLKPPPRQTLLEQLAEETAGGSHRLTVCCAPTGYGKTRTMLAWLGDGSDPGERTSWVHCEPGQTTDELWIRLGAALARITGKPTPPLPNKPNLTQAEVAQATKRVVYQLAASLESRAALVIDDYHLATSADLDLALAELSSKSPRLTLVVVGRRVTLLSRPLIATRARMRLIGTSDLALTLPEAHEFAATLGVPASEQLSRALEACDGWPAVISAVLLLGSDTYYLHTEHGLKWNPAANAESFDPIGNLDDVTLDYVEFLSPDSRTLLRATAYLGTLSGAHAVTLLDGDESRALATLQLQLELGSLVAERSTNGMLYQLSRAAQGPLRTLALRALSAEKRGALAEYRANELARVDPFTAFLLLLDTEHYPQAEAVLARNLSLIVTEQAACAPLLRALPEQVLLAHPTFTAALLFGELANTDNAPPALRHLLGLWRRGLDLALPGGPDAAGHPNHLALLGQAMVYERMSGRFAEAAKLMDYLESRLTPLMLETRDGQGEKANGMPGLDHASVPHALTEYAGSLPSYLREAAATALMVGDFVRAHRNLDHLLRQVAHWGARGAPPSGSARTISDTAASTAWQLTALSELAFTKMLDGDLHGCAETLDEFDRLGGTTPEQAPPGSGGTGVGAPGISWAGGMIARAHLAAERGDMVLLAYAHAQLAPLGDRLEAWQLLVIAEVAALHGSRGPDVALAHLRASIAHAAPQVPPHGEWSNYLLAYEAELCCVLGDLRGARALIETELADGPIAQLELARLALYEGDNSRAIVTAQSVGDPGTTKRMRLERQLIFAVAAWCSGRREDAVAAIGDAASRIERYGTVASLTSMPYEQVRELLLAAIEAATRSPTERGRQLAALWERLEAIPPAARAHRCERLTEMELQTLRAIAEYRSAPQAAEALFVTPGTVKKHLSAVYRKLGVNGRDEALLVAHRAGLFT